MPHWLMETEQKELQYAHQLLQESRLTQNKKLQLSRNYAAHKEAYEGFIAILNNLCGRANALRTHAVEISTEASHENNSYSFSGCKRFDKIAPRIFHPFTRRLHYKQVRQIVFSPADTMATFEIAVNEMRLYRLKRKSTNTYFYLKLSDDFRQPGRLTFTGNICNLNMKNAIKIFDWLAFMGDFAVPSLFKLGEQK